MGKLTDRQIQAFTYPKDKGRHADGDSLFLDVRSGSLFLEVFPTGGKYWRFGFRFPKGDKTKRKLTLGAYPKVTLKTARELAQERQTAAGSWHRSTYSTPGAAGEGRRKHL